MLRCVVIHFNRFFEAVVYYKRIIEIALSAKNLDGRAHVHGSPVL